MSIQKSCPAQWTNMGPCSLPSSASDRNGCLGSTPCLPPAQPTSTHCSGMQPHTSSEISFLLAPSLLLLSAPHPCPPWPPFPFSSTYFKTRIFFYLGLSFEQVHVGPPVPGRNKIFSLCDHFANRMSNSTGQYVKRMQRHVHWKWPIREAYTGYSQFGYHKSSKIIFFRVKSGWVPSQ